MCLQSYPPRTRCLDVILSGFADSIGLYREQAPRQHHQAQRALAALGPSHWAEAPMGSIPEGAQGRLLLGRALVKSPRLLLLDEPCQGLDADQRQRVRDHVEHAASQGIQVIVVSHHAEDLPRCLTHALRLEAGRVVAMGPRAHCLTVRSASGAAR